MIYASNPAQELKPYLMNSKNSALMVALCILLLLTGCATDSHTNLPTLNLYQAPALRLKAGAVVQTQDGIYTAQQDEVWHSDYRYRQLEREKIGASY